MDDEINDFYRSEAKEVEYERQKEEELIAQEKD